MLGVDPVLHNQRGLYVAGLGGYRFGRSIFFFIVSVASASGLRHFRRLCFSAIFALFVCIADRQPSSHRLVISCYFIQFIIQYRDIRSIIQFLFRYSVRYSIWRIVRLHIDLYAFFTDYRERIWSTAVFVSGSISHRDFTMRDVMIISIDYICVSLFFRYQDTVV